MATAQVLQKALQYYSYGWNVVPVFKNTKRPALAEGEFERLFNGRMSEQELIQHMQRAEVGNVGIITGPTSKIVALDYDVRNMPDSTRMDYYQAKYPTGRKQRTPSGGQHGLYKYPDNIALPNRDLEPGVQMFGSHHLLVLAPSVVQNEKLTGSYEWLSEGELGDFPLEILSLSPNEKLPAFNADEVLQSLEYALVNGRFPDGSHNDTIYRASLVLASRGTPDSIILQMMLMLDRNDPTPQGERAVEGAVRRACEVAAKNVLLSKPTEISVEDVLDSKPLDRPDETFEAISYSLLTQEYEDYETKWLIQDWITDQSVMMMAAPPERFKTWIAADMAISVMSGCPFLGQYEVHRTGNVLFIQQEDFGPNLIKRFNLIERGKIANCRPEMEISDDGAIYSTYNPSGYDIFFHTRSQLSFDNKESIARLYNVAMQIKPALIVVDPFYSLSVKDDYYKGAANIIQSVIKEIRRRTGATFLFVHHTSKGKDGEGDPIGRQAAWGSQFLNAAMEGVITVGRPKGERDTTVVAYPRFKDEQAGKPVKLNFHINKNAEDDKDKFRVDVSYDTMDDKERAVKEVLRDLGPTKLADLYEEVAEHFPAKSRLSEFLKDCPGIVRAGHGVYSLAPDALLEV